jgi:hypothetical protein
MGPIGRGVTPSDDDVVDAMIAYGGGFVSQLGKAWRAADRHNHATLKLAFLDLWEKYTEIAKAKATRMSER